MNIIGLCEKNNKRIKLPKGSPQHWSSCVINGRCYLVMNTWNYPGCVAWELNVTPVCAVGDRVGRITPPQRLYFEDFVIDVAADWA
jgi:hypothetical protein